MSEINWKPTSPTNGLCRDWTSEDGRFNIATSGKNTKNIWVYRLTDNGIPVGNRTKNHQKLRAVAEAILAKDDDADQDEIAADGRYAAMVRRSRFDI
jgi:hypothetical protein